MSRVSSSAVVGKNRRTFLLTLAVACLLLTGPGSDTGSGPVSRGAPPAAAAIPDDFPLVPSAARIQRPPAAQPQRSSTKLRTTPSAPRTSVALAFVSADPTRTDVAQVWRPYHRLAPERLGSGVRDSSGVRMHLIGSTKYNHPVGQASDGISSLESWRLTGDRRFLKQALGNAHRLVDRRIESRGAWFFPYPYDFALHGNKSDVITAPWYSAMAQGKALSLFSRLQAETKDPQWGVALTRTLASLSLGPTRDAAVPFVSWVDANNRLWLEEYAQLPLRRADRTINGHIFAMFGLWDAVRFTADPEAERLFRGAAATIRHYVNADIRQPSWVSKYCLTHGVLNAKYHTYVTHQLLTLQAITGNPDWARFADEFRDDYPRRDVKGTVMLAAGTVTGRQFDSAGKVITTRVLRLSRAIQVRADRRERILGHGYNYRITTGTLAGYYVAEAYPSVQMTGILAHIAYPYPRVVALPAGKATAYVAHERTAALGSPRSVTFAQPSQAHFDRSGWIGGRLMVRVSDGGFAGRWVPAGTTH